MISSSYSSQVRPVLTGHRGAIAAAHPWAVSAGQAMLQKGGSAVDALIAAQAMLCVLMPDACGIGGDMLALVHDTEPVAVNGAGAAPAGLTDWSVSGGASVTTPGIAHAWESMAARWGRMRLAEVLAPAVAVAREGFRVPGSLAGPVEAQRGRLVANGAGAWALLGLRAGEIWRQPELADLLEAIGREGSAAFYRGDYAGAVVRAIGRFGGAMSEADLAGHETAILAPLRVDWGGVEVFVQPPMAQGVLLGMVLQAFDRLGALEAGVRDHALVELSEAAFAFRDHVAEGEALLGCELPVDLARAQRRGGPRAYLHTAGVAVADAAGLCVSSLVSVFDDFGSCVFVPEGGFTLNNRGAGFTRAPNEAGAGKRPVHTLAPCLVRHEGGVLAMATPGADGQIQTLAQILVACCRGGVDLASAIAAPRWRSQNHELLIENHHQGQEALARLGHRLQAIAPGDVRFGGVVAAGFNAEPFACADWRRENWAGAV